MAKTCKCGCGRPVFGGGYSKGCQYLRADGKAPKPLKRSPLKQSSGLTRQYNSTKSVTQKASRKVRNKIKYSSTKRMKNTALYEQAKINVRKSLQKEGNWKCFFTQNEITIETPYYHHKLGKEGELLYDENNIHPVENHAHTLYHHQDIKYLLENTDWYVTFIERVYKEDSKVFAIESRRMMKSGLGLRYLSGFFGKLINEIHLH